MIQLGVCTGAENAELLKRIGFDYIELGFSSTAALTQQAFDETVRTLEDLKLPVLAMNGMLPAGFALCSDDLDKAALREYLERAFARAGRLGVHEVGFGSGGARRYPEGMEYAVAMNYLVDFLRLAAPIAEGYGIVIGIEPLRVQESNILNSVMEGRQLAKMANLKNVSVMADLYHMACGNEGFLGLKNGPIAHCHIAETQKRGFPSRKDSCRALYGELFEALRQIGYDGGLSVEGGSQNFEQDAREAFALLDSLRRV